MGVRGSRRALGPATPTTPPTDAGRRRPPSLGGDEEAQRIADERSALSTPTFHRTTPALPGIDRAPRRRFRVARPGHRESPGAHRPPTVGCRQNGNHRRDRPCSGTPSALPDGLENWESPRGEGRWIHPIPMMNLSIVKSPISRIGPSHPVPEPHIHRTPSRTTRGEGVRDSDLRLIQDSSSDSYTRCILTSAVLRTALTTHSTQERADSAGRSGSKENSQSTGETGGTYWEG